MSVFDSGLELDVLFDDLVEGFINSGKSYDWIEERLTNLVGYAIQDHKDSVEGTNSDEPKEV
jgi:hypothetical protein